MSANENGEMTDRLQRLSLEFQQEHPGYQVSRHPSWTATDDPHAARGIP
jgi:hypothetical protein